MCLLVVIHWKLKDNTNEREEIVVEYDIESIHQVVPAIDDNVEECLLVHLTQFHIGALFILLGSADSLSDLVQRVLIFSNPHCQLFCSFFYFLWEVFREHVINVDYKCEGNETLNDHRRSWSLTIGQNQNNLREYWAYHLQGAEDNVDEPPSFSSLSCLYIFKIS